MKTMEKKSVVQVLLLFVLWSVSSSVVAAQTHLRHNSQLWTVHGRHGRSLLWSIDTVHRSGNPYSRPENSLVISAEVGDLDSLLVPGKVFPVPLPFAGRGMCEFMLRDSGLMSETYKESVGPNVKSLRGTAVSSIGDSETERLCKGAKAIFDFGTIGLHVMILPMDAAPIFVDPYTMGETTTYSVYSQVDEFAGNGSPSMLKAAKDYLLQNMQSQSSPEPMPLKWTCDVSENVVEEGSARRLQVYDDSPVSPRTIRIAVATTVDFVEYFGSQASAIDAVRATVTRVSSIYERDFAVEFQMAGNAMRLSPESTESGGLRALRDSNQFLGQIHDFIASVVPNAEYDVGHMLTGSVNGLARMRSACSDSIKGMAVSGSTSPVADAFQVDFVSHEIGHQFGASHTMIGTACGQSAAQTLRMEPGSGSTIMAYAGLCNQDDLQKNTDAFMHAQSLNEIQSYFASRPSCGSSLKVQYPRPELQVAGRSIQVPLATPFELQISNPNENYTYTWDQMDSAVQLNMLAESFVQGGRFRTYLPRSKSYRKWFPSKEVLFADSDSEDLSDPQGDIISQSVIRAEVAKMAEALPAKSQFMIFAAVARSAADEKSRAVSIANVDVEAVSMGPFRLEYPTAPTDMLYTNSTNEIRWSVSGTNFLAPEVSVLLSFDNGDTFDFLWATEIKNTGRADIFLGSEVCEHVQDAAGNAVDFGVRVMVSSAPLGPYALPVHHFFTVSGNKVKVDCTFAHSSAMDPLLMGLIGAGAGVVVLLPLAALVYKKFIAAPPTGANYVDASTAAAGGGTDPPTAVAITVSNGTETTALPIAKAAKTRQVIPANTAQGELKDTFEPERLTPVEPEPVPSIESTLKRTASAVPQKKRLSAKRGLKASMMSRVLKKGGSEPTDSILAEASNPMFSNTEVDVTVQDEPSQLQVTVQDEPSQLQVTVQDEPSQLQVTMQGEPSQLHATVQGEPSQLQVTVQGEPSQLQATVQNEPSQLQVTVQDESRNEDRRSNSSRNVSTDNTNSDRILLASESEMALTMQQEADEEVEFGGRIEYQHETKNVHSLGKGNVFESECEEEEEVGATVPSHEWAKHQHKQNAPRIEVSHEGKRRQSVEKWNSNVNLEGNIAKKCDSFGSGESELSDEKGVAPVATFV